MNTSTNKSITSLNNPELKFNFSFLIFLNSKMKKKGNKAKKPKINLAAEKVRQKKKQQQKTINL